MDSQTAAKTNTLIGTFIVIGGIVMLGLVGYVVYSVLQDSIDDVNDTDSVSVINNTNTNTNMNTDSAVVDTSD